MIDIRRLCFIVVGLLMFASISHAATYFVRNGGSDGASGLSDANAWANISRVNSQAFVAGDIIQFKRGSTWTDELIADNSGTSGNPITYQAYDTGARPIIQAAASPQGPNAGTFANSIQVTGDWNVIKDFLARNAHQSGVYITDGADSNIVQNVEATATGLGIILNGNNGLATGNFVHDGQMITNDATPSNDYGANCFWVEGNNNEISYNIGTNCMATSMDFGYDGGFVEIGTTSANLLVHHNWIENSNGVLEIGPSITVNDAVFSYNVILATVTGSCSSVGANGGASVSNFRFEHNTVYAQGLSGSNCFRQFVGDNGTLSWLTVRNNIFFSAVQIAQEAPGIHTQNRYHMVNMVNGSGVGFTLGTGETTGDPLFVTNGTDFHLQTGSAARDTGTDLGYTLDYDNNPVPDGSAPDLGAFEFVSADTLAPAAPTNVRVTKP